MFTECYTRDVEQQKTDSEALQHLSSYLNKFQRERERERGGGGGGGEAEKKK